MSRSASSPPTVNKGPSPQPRDASDSNEQSPLLSKSYTDKGNYSDSGRRSESPRSSAGSSASKAGEGRFLVMLYSFLLLVTAVGNSIFFKKMTNHMPNYPYFISLMSTFVYVPIFGLVCVYEVMYTNYITDEMLRMSKIKFFALGAFDSLSGLFMLFGAVHTSGSTQALLVNAVIPITMALSVVFLNTKFMMTQYAGAATIMMGVAVVLLPNILAGPGGSADADVPIFNLIFLISVIPNALSAIYKEFLFAKVDVDVNFLQAWVAVWQLVFSLLMIPLNTLSILGPNALDWAELPSAMIGGTKCLFGTNSILLPDCWVPPHSSKYFKECDNCESAWIYVLTYLLFNIGYNVFSVLVIKYGGASLLYIVLTLRLPMVQIAFSMPFVNNPPDNFQWPSLVGLVMILIGLIAYRWSAMKAPIEGQETVVGFVGENQLPVVIVRPTMAHLRRSARQIRGSFYSRIGVIDSPRTPHSRHGSPRHGSPALGRRPDSRGSGVGSVRRPGSAGAARSGSPATRTSNFSPDSRKWRDSSAPPQASADLEAGQLDSELSQLDKYGAPKQARSSALRTTHRPPNISINSSSRSKDGDRRGSQ